MDFMNTMDFVVNTDLTNIDVDLPEELGEKICSLYGQVITTGIEVAQHLYKTEKPTEEQFGEATAVMVLWFRKQLENAINNG